MQNKNKATSPIHVHMYSENTHTHQTHKDSHNYNQNNLRTTHMHSGTIIAKTLTKSQTQNIVKQFIKYLYTQTQTHTTLEASRV